MGSTEKEMYTDREWLTKCERERVRKNVSQPKGGRERKEKMGKERYQRERKTGTKERKTERNKY